MTSKNPSMAEQFKLLEQITKDFESDNLDLEAAIPKFKQGVELVKSIKLKLKKIDSVVKQVNSSFQKEDVEDEQPGTTIDDIDF